jgi:hypothetical protein
MLPDIDFDKIRQHRGSQDFAFEELCCQLAALERRPAGSLHYRKDRGSDGGVECFTQFADGTETGWQAKFYHRMDASLTRSLTDSFAAAVKNHPNLTRFIVCIPFDLPDGSRGTTALDTWSNWRKDRIADAKLLGRTLKIDLWGASELKERLGRDEPLRMGRVLYWFDAETLSPIWFAEKLDRTIRALGSRYTAKTNVELPIRQVLEAISRTGRLADEQHRWSDLLSAHARPRPAGIAPGTAEEVLAGHLDAVLTALSETEISPNEEYPVNAWRGLADTALDCVRNLWHAQLSTPASSATELYTEPRLRKLLEVLSIIADGLRKDPWQHANSGSLLVTGSAGKGKSHLLADACKAAVEGGHPALLLMSSRLVEGDLWQQIMDELDLRKLDAKTFLGALDAAAEAAGSRLAIMIDGINERHGLEIWPENMATILHDVKQFPRLAVVFSCRSTYVDYALPDGLSESDLPRIEHQGFSAEDAIAYIAHRNVALPSHPFPLEEFHTPLFLKVCCDALEKSGETRFPRGARGVTAIFDFYSSAVVSAINRSMKLVASRRFVEKAINAIASEIERTGQREIPYGRAAELVDAVRPSNGRAEDDLLFLLENEGMFAKETLYGDSSEDEVESIRFVFERHSDHVVAKGILDSLAEGYEFIDPRLPPRLAAVISHSAPGINQGILEALAVQLPERFSVEICDLPQDDDRRWISYGPFLASICARDPAKVTSRTMKLLDEIGERNDVLDAVISLAIEDTSAFNADYLHERLSSLQMQERDANWSIDASYGYEDSESRIAKLVDWALSIDENSIDGPTALLVATTLAWMCSSTSLGLRDRATKSMVAVLTSLPNVVIALVERFARVDDLYIVERLAAAAYGAALQGRWTDDDLDIVAKAVYGSLRETPPNVLVRDHLRSLLEYARRRGCPLEGIPTPLTWSSDWPLERVSDDLIASYTRTYATGYIGRDEIVGSSVKGGDFARYVLDRFASNYSGEPKGTLNLPTIKKLRASWIDRFNTTASPDLQEELLRLTRKEETNRENSPWRPSEKLLEARQKFMELVGDDVFEDYRTVAMDWRRGEMFQERPRSDGLACFNLAWVRRWICWKAHDLGWREDLHGEFDLSVRNGRSHNRLERIGKKYQWLALFELTARMADNLELLPSKYSEEFEWLRNIDPSLLVRKAGSGEPSRKNLYWAHRPTVKTAMTPEEGIIWRDSDLDYMDGAAAIELNDPAAKKHWLAIASFRQWSRSSTKNDRRFRFDAWARLSCVVVPQADLGIVLEHLQEKDLRDDHVLPSNERLSSRMHLGEHGWLNSVDELRPVMDWANIWIDDEWAGLEVPAFPTAMLYERSPQERDQSLDADVSLTLPSLWLMRALGLRLTSGRNASYDNDTSRTLFLDPSVQNGGPSVGLVDRGALLSHLHRHALTAVWVSSGEKNLYKDGGQGFGGRRHYTTISFSRDQEIVHLDRFSQLEEPDIEQLRLFLS